MILLLLYFPLRQNLLRHLPHLARASERMCQAELSHGAPEVVNHSSFAFRVHRFLALLGRVDVHPWSGVNGGGIVDHCGGRKVYHLA